MRSVVVMSAVAFAIDLSFLDGRAAAADPAAPTSVKRILDSNGAVSLLVEALAGSVTPMALRLLGCGRADGRLSVVKDLDEAALAGY